MKNRRIALRIILLLLWIAGILLPLYSFRRFSARYRAAFDWVFQSHASHVLMHTFLYAVLACLLVSTLSATLRRHHWAAAVSAIVGVAVVAVLQEAIQMQCESVMLGPDEIFDVFVDLNGGALGVLLWLRFTGRRTKTAAEVARRDTPD